MTPEEHEKAKMDWRISLLEHIARLKQIGVIELVELLCSSLDLSTAFLVSLLQLAMRASDEDIIGLYIFLTNPTLKGKVWRNGILGLW